MEAPRESHNVNFALSNRKFNFELLLGPSQRKQKRKHEKRACFMLTNIFPVAIVVVVVSQESDSSERVR